MLSSLKLTKELEKRGFKKSSVKRHIKISGRDEDIWEDLDVVQLPAYDLIYDLAIKHGKELFGEVERCKFCKRAMNNDTCGECSRGYYAGVNAKEKCFEWRCKKIFEMFMTGKNQDTIEDYIIKNLVI